MPHMHSRDSVFLFLPVPLVLPGFFVTAVAMGCFSLCPVAFLYAKAALLWPVFWGRVDKLQRIEKQTT